MSEETKKKKWSLSNLIFSSEEETESSESTEATEDINISNTSGNLVQDLGVLPISIPTTGNGIFDQNFHDMLSGVIEENNIPGNDYFEFKQSTEAMSSIAGLNESAKLLTAFATLKATDPTIDKAKLMDSIDHYVGVLRQEEAEFQGAMESETETKVNSRRNEASELVDKNKEIAQKIQNLNEEIIQNNNKSLTLNNEAAQAEAKIVQTNKNFIATLAHVVSGLETDKQKISDLIQEATPKA